MKMIYPSIYLCHFHFLSSVSYSFQHTSLLPPWLNLFLSMYFNLFDTIVNKIFLISLSERLLVYKNITDLCILILYPATLLKSLINSNSFLVESLGFSIYNIMSSANSDSFTFFPIWMPLILFMCPTSVSRTFNIMLNKSGRSGHPWLVPDLGGNAFSFSLLSIMLAVGLSNMTFIMWS